MKPVLFTRHALERMLREGFSEQDVMDAVYEGVIRPEGKSKFKALRHAKGCWLIAVCAEYGDHIRVITVIRRSS